MKFSEGHIPWNKGVKNWRVNFHHSENSKEKIRQARKLQGSNVWNNGIKNCYSQDTILKMRMAKLGTKISEEHKRKIGKKSKGNKNALGSVGFWKGKKLSDSHKHNLRGKRPNIQGEKNHKWIKDRTLLQRYNNTNKDRRSSIYRYWRMEVYKRDRFKCKVNDRNCFGKIVAHHILSYTKYPELRYNINNGITLCQFHHPRKRVEEQRLIPFFQSMVEVKGII